MALCGGNFPCGGCMDVDSQTTKANMGKDAPLDAQGQLTQPMKKDVQMMIKTQKNAQWGNADLTSGDSQN